jgi:hypothetical protein
MDGRDLKQRDIATTANPNPIRILFDGNDNTFIKKFKKEVLY